MFGCAFVVNVPVYKLAVILLTPVMLPPEPPPKLRLPVIFAAPLMFAPVPVTTTTLGLPAELILTLPLATGILTLLFPLAIPAALIATQLNPPEPFVCR